ncbi:MAG: carboxyl transferase domain-containing protein [Peptostreptococcaceae bacterium]|nr:carboxyl transferase domain-containing protein [Peptostreptococcaceae bacterium]
MADKLQQLIEKRQKIEEAGGAKRVQKQHDSGKLTARERMNILFDENTFVELDAFVKHRCTNFDMATMEAPAEGVITGYGKVDGRLVYAFAQDFTVVGGSLGEMHAAKIVKVMDLALKMGAPCVGMNDSGGARIQEAVDALKGYGSIFYRNTISSGVIPQISIIMGPCAGGAVYSPAITDFIFMVENTSQMFITGPQVIKAVTGEVVTAEALGGAITHNTVSGVAHYRSSDDAAAILEVRRLLSFLPSNNMEKPPVYETNDDPNRMIEELNSIIPDSPNKAYDVKDIIRSLVDDGDFMEYQELFAPNIVTGYARLNGQTIGIVANQPRVMAGSLDINASDKAGRFIRTCDAYNIPLLSIEDVPGFLPGTSQEYGGIIRHGAKMLYAFSEATVPKITLITRKAYGGSYIAMCSKELGADMVLAWPTAEIAVMGPDGAANIIFRKDIDASDDPAKTRTEKIEEYKDEFATPYKAAERGYVDDVIEPSHSRIRLIDALDMLRNKKEQRPSKKHGNIPL